MDEGRVPDFFDHWMEEYISKVAEISLRSGIRRPSQRNKSEVAMKKRRSRNWRR